ncbi:hypothetical protein JZ751_028140 [Albula glossodonta]|uniref:Uncharacterized protein n=1 Tax=Albula glossodonta TaxID=121402 RepID=A0A8T2PJ70_9TELE|nr:hypothetical protein JZ751_028140 [Albula glossodonta]
MKGNMNEQEDNSKESMLPHVVPPGQVKDEQMAQSSEDSKDRAEETRGTDNIEEPFSGGQESTKKSGEEEEDMANETSKGLSENSTDLPSKFFSDAEVSSRPQGAEQGTTEEEISQGEGKEEQPDS